MALSSARLRYPRAVYSSYRHVPPTDWQSSSQNPCLPKVSSSQAPASAARDRGHNDHDGYPLELTCKSVHYRRSGATSRESAVTGTDSEENINPPGSSPFPIWKGNTVGKYLNLKSHPGFEKPWGFETLERKIAPPAPLSTLFLNFPVDSTPPQAHSCPALGLNSLILASSFAGRRCQPTRV